VAGIDTDNSVDGVETCNSTMDATEGISISDTSSAELNRTAILGIDLHRRIISVEDDHQVSDASPVEFFCTAKLGVDLYSREPVNSCYLEIPTVSLDLPEACRKPLNNFRPRIGS